MGAAVKVEELTADHLAVRWSDATLFLLFDGPIAGRSLEMQIERLFAGDPDAATAELKRLPLARREIVRAREVRPGMTREEVTLSWGPPARTDPGPAPGAEAWLYSREASWFARVEFRDGAVTSVTWQEGEEPLVRNAYPRLPRKKRPFQAW